MNILTRVFVGIATVSIFASLSACSGQSSPMVATGQLRAVSNSADISGEVKIDGDCIILDDGGTQFTTIWPLGTTVSESDSTEIRMANGSLIVGEQIEPSRGQIMSAEKFRAVVQGDGSSVDDPSDCTASDRDVVVITSVKDFAGQE